MSRLTLDAVADDSLCLEQGDYDGVIFISVTDDAGNPVDGLTLGNFTVSARTATPGFTLHLRQVVTTAERGFYLLFVEPASGLKWSLGIYLVAIVVSRTTGNLSNLAVSHGQTVARLVTHPKT